MTEHNSTQSKPIPWHGGVMPVRPDVRVKVLKRNGDVSEGPASKFYWLHTGSDYDIHFYRIL